MAEKSSSSSGGIGFGGLLTIVFITLKLCHVIDWSWLWVLSPLWIVALFIIVIVIAIALLQIYEESKSSRGKW